MLYLAPVANNGVKLHDSLLFRVGELAVLKVRPEVVSPAKSAALPTSLETLNVQGNNEQVKTFFFSLLKKELNEEFYW